MAGAAGTQSSTLTLSGLNTTLTMLSQGGSSTLNVGGSAGAINITGNGGSGPIELVVNPGAALRFGDPTGTGIAVYEDTTTTGQLDIGNDTAGTKVASFNQTTNICNLGNPLNSGAIYLNNTTTVTSSASRPPVGGIVLTQTGATTSEIYQQVNSGGGSIQLGATVSNPQTVFITDPTGVADAAYVDITGGTSGTSALRLQGCRPSQTTATVSTNFASGGGGILNLTSGYNDGQAKIEIADNSITFGRPPSAAAPGWAPILLYGPQATGPGTITVDCSTLPSGWCVVYGVSSSGANPLSPGDRASMFNTILYSGPGNVITAGGLGGVPAYCTCLPSATNNTSLDVNFASATSASYAIYGMPLIGG